MTDIYKILTDCELNNELVKIIIEYIVNNINDIGNLKLVDKYIKNLKSLIIKLYFSSIARSDCEFANNLLTNDNNAHNKWYTNSQNAPMLLFEFECNIGVINYVLMSANDCVHRDPYHFYLFGCNNIDIIADNNLNQANIWPNSNNIDKYKNGVNVNFKDMVILHEYNGDNETDVRVLWNNERYFMEYFDCNQKVIKQGLKFKYIGLHILKGNRNTYDIQISKIAFVCAI